MLQDLTESVVLQTATTTPDSQGGRSTSWGNLATVFAGVKAMGQSEILALREFIAAIGAYEVTIRIRADVTTGMRVLWTPRGIASASQKTLLIHGVQPKDQTWLVLRCAEVT